MYLSLTTLFLCLGAAVLGSPTPLSPGLEELSRRVPYDICKLEITEIRTCEPQDQNLYALFKLWGPKFLVDTAPFERPESSSPGVPINPSKPFELKARSMDYMFKITGRHDKDDIQFQYGLLTWTTDSTSGFAKCRGVSADDWNKGGSHCRTDSRKFHCEFAC